MIYLSQLRGRGEAEQAKYCINNYPKFSENSDYLMGEYGVGIQSLSPVDFNRFVNNQSLFSPENSPRSRTMQDAVLEKSAAKQEQLSPSINHISDQSEESAVKNGQVEVTNTSADEKSVDTNVLTSTNQLETNTQLITSLANVSQSFWTPPQHGVPEETFGQGAFQSVNGTVNFQQFPANTLVNSGNMMQAHVSIPSQSLGHRRAITAQHNFPQRPMQQGMILNNAKSYPQWSNAHATLTPWTQAQIQQQHQRRSVPNMNIPNFAQMKGIKASFPQSQQTLSVIAPSKFRRSTSFPSQIHQAGFAKPHVDFVGIDELQRDSMLSYQVGNHICDCLDAIMHSSVIFTK